MRGRLLIAVLLSSVFLLAVTSSIDARNRIARSGGAASGATELDEFVGPFANWINIKTGKRYDGTGSSLCTSAVGNGVADDTAALQSCLNVLNSTAPVLWMPAGTYKITAALTLTSGHNVSVIGADPATTTISWGGAANSAVMLQVKGTHYSRVNRLTFNGNSNVGVLIQQSSDGGAFFDTGNEYTDDVFTNAGGSYDSGISVDFACGLIVGVSVLQTGNGCAETAMLRDHFSNGGYGIDMGNNNALDMWVWYSTFTNKVAPLVSNAGNLNAFHSNFFNSSSSDVSFGFSGPMMFSWNYSTGAAQHFVDCSSFSANPLPLVIEGNTVVNTGSSQSIDCGWQGPLTVLDNTIISKVGATVPAVNMSNGTGDIISTGNRYTIGTANTCSTGGAVQKPGRCHAVGDTVGSFSDPGAPTLPGTPPNTGPGGSNIRTIFEVVPTGTSADTALVQSAINSAAAIGNGAVVHLQTGTYQIDPLTVPGNTFIQIIGDGYNTFLNDRVTHGGALITCGSACKAWFREFAMSGNSNSLDGIHLSGADQPGGRVFMEQPYLNVNSTESLLVNGLNYTNVEIHDGVFTAGAVTGIKEGIKVVGGSGANIGTTNLFAGQTSENNNFLRIEANGSLSLRQVFNDTGGATPTGATLAQVSGTGGALSISSMAAYLGPVVNPPNPGNYFELTNFSGISALVNVSGHIGKGTPNEIISGAGTGASNLNIGFIGCTDNEFVDTTSPADAYDLLNPQRVAVCGNGGAITQLSEASQNVSSLGAFLNTTLAPLRAALPTIPGILGDPALASGVTDTRIYRVNVSQCINAIVIGP